MSIGNWCPSGNEYFCSRSRRTKKNNWKHMSNIPSISKVFPISMILLQPNLLLKNAGPEIYKWG